jgi:hypothetical protein
VEVVAMNDIIEDRELRDLIERMEEERDWLDYHRGQWLFREVLPGIRRNRRYQGGTAAEIAAQACDVVALLDDAANYLRRLREVRHAARN